MRISQGTCTGTDRRCHVRRSGRRAANSCQAVLASRLDAAVFADGGPATGLAFRLLASVLTEGGPTAGLAFRLDAALFADGGPAAGLALHLSAAVFARVRLHSLGTSGIQILFTTLFSLGSDQNKFGRKFSFESCKDMLSVC